MGKAAALPDSRLRPRQFTVTLHRMSRLESAESAVLPRVLGPITAVAIVAGTIIGSGVFKKPQTIAAALPYSGLVALVWIAGGLLVLLGALAYAEVAVLFPRAGGNYVFLREGYGRLAGFLWGWVDFGVIRTGSLAALATIFAESCADVVSNAALQQAIGLPPGVGLGERARVVLTLAVLVALGLVNIRGVGWGGGLQVVVTAVKLGSLLALAVLPWLLLSRQDATPTDGPSLAHLQPAWPDGWAAVSFRGLASAFLAVLWPYHGWMNIAPIAGEVRQPQRNLPLALLAGVGLVIALYLGVNLAYYLTLPGSVMAQTRDTPVATAVAAQLLGPLGAAAASAAVLCSVFGSLNGNLLVGPRLLYAMAEDGLVPQALGGVHPRYRTPAVAIAVYAGWACLLVLAVAGLTEAGLLAHDKSHFDRLTDFAMFGAVVFETMAVLSIFRFRRLLPDAPRPYRCPGYPLVPAVYAVLPACVLVNMFSEQPVEALSGVGFVFLGTVVYYCIPAAGDPARRAAGNALRADREPPIE